MTRQEGENRKDTAQDQLKMSMNAARICWDYQFPYSPSVNSMSPLLVPYLPLIVYLVAWERHSKTYVSQFICIGAIQKGCKTYYSHLTLKVKLIVQSMNKLNKVRIVQKLVFQEQNRPFYFSQSVMRRKIQIFLSYKAISFYFLYIIQE